MFVDSVEIMLQNVLKEQFYPVLNQFVYVGQQKQTGSRQDKTVLPEHSTTRFAVSVE